jgi:SpoVK/Ycf46/Vps4 family AAA+-type ATPase
LSGARAVLLETARRYALAFKEAEVRGDYETASVNLKRAIEALEDFVRLYPDDLLTPRIRRLIIQYRDRLKLLERRMLLASTTGEEYEVEINEQKEKSNGSRLPPDFVLREKPKVTFDDIAGLEEAKQAIREAIIYPIKRPDLFPLGWPRGILLYGPPGTGKTMLAAAVANEVDGEFLYVDSASIMSKWLGEGEKNVRRLFDYARSRAKEGVPVIIFMDEIDALLGVHTAEVGGEVRVRNQFLKEMDGIQDKSCNLHVYVIGATNKPWKLDEPFIRRFQKRIYVPLPDFRTRRKLLELLTRKIRLAPDVDLDELARMLDGYSGSDIKDIVQGAYMKVVREYFERGAQGELRPVSMNDFKEIIARRRPSVDKNMVKLFEEWRRRFEAL